jgi:hypothetical protein
MTDRERSAITPYPLAWPAGWPRSAVRKTSRFARGSSRVHTGYANGQPTYSWHRRSLTVFNATQHVLREIDRLGAKRVIVSSNLRLNRDGTPASKQRPPEDPGVAVYFDLDGEPRVLACDRFDEASHNLHAIALHIEAMRGMERWGVGTVAQAFAGFVALPERAGASAPHVELGLEEPATSAEQVERAFRVMARLRHPDQGGTHEAFIRLQAARDAALEQLRTS